MPCGPLNLTARKDVFFCAVGPPTHENMDFHRHLGADGWDLRTEKCILTARNNIFYTCERTKKSLMIKNMIFFFKNENPLQRMTQKTISTYNTQSSAKNIGATDISFIGHVQQKTSLRKA